MPMSQRQEPEGTESTEFGLSVSFSTVGEALQTELGYNGFNEYGVKGHPDGSIDVLYRAMEPGIRNGFEVTQEFLQTTTGYQYGKLPFQMDHSKSQMANVGHLKDIWFRDGAMGIRGHIPNTGSSVRNDVIADFNHDPPAITDGSVKFDERSVEFDLPDGYESIEEWAWLGDHENEHPTFVDARIQEFSLTPFPGGYDDGGLSPAFRSQFSKPNVSKSQKAAEPAGRRRYIDGPYSITRK